MSDKTMEMKKRSFVKALKKRETKVNLNNNSVRSVNGLWHQASGSITPNNLGYIVLLVDYNSSVIVDKDFKIIKVLKHAKARISHKDANSPFIYIKFMEKGGDYDGADGGANYYNVLTDSLLFSEEQQLQIACGGDFKGGRARVQIKDGSDQVVNEKGEFLIDWEYLEDLVETKVSPEYDKFRKSKYYVENMNSKEREAYRKRAIENNEK